MTKIQEQPQPILMPLREFTPGMITAVNDFLTPPNAFRILENAYNDEYDGNQYGNVRGRKGYAIVGNQITAGKSALGIHSALFGGGTSDDLVVFMNDTGDTKAQAYYYNAGVFTEINLANTWQPSAKVRMTTFLDYIFAVNGTDPVRTWDGNPSNSWGTTYAVDAPAGSLIIEAFDQVHIAGVNAAGQRSSIFSSSVVSGNSINFSGGGEELPINPDDGDYLTALDFNNEMLAYKNSAMYKWNGSSTFADLLISVGTPTQETVSTTNGVTIFVGINKESIGLYEYKGEYPNEISKPIRNLVDQLDLANQDQWSVFTDSDHAYISVGDLTVGELTYLNLIFRYCISKGTWAVYTMADQFTNRVTSAQMGTLRFQSDRTRTIVVSDNDGKLYTWNSGYTDNGEPIFCRLRLAPYGVDRPTDIKNIQRMAVYCRTTRQLRLLCRYDGQGVFEELKPCRGEKTIFDLNREACTFEFQLLVENDDEPFEFSGIQPIDVTIRGTTR